MKRYMTGAFTGVLVGAVVAGVWILRRPTANVYKSAWRGASHTVPKAWHAARSGGKSLIHLAKRRLG